MKYRMEDGTILDTDNATKSWEEAKDHNGSNLISRQTGQQWVHQELHRSRKGRYYLECWSDWQGSRRHAEWISEEAAARWLILNEDELPEELRKFEAEVSE